MPVFPTPEESEKQYKRLRRDVGASETVIDDTLAEEYFEEAQELYPSNEAKMIAQARVIALQGIRASAALLGKYAQNQSQEDMTKVFDNISAMLEDAKEAVDQVPIPNTLSTAPGLFAAARGRRGE